MKAIHKNKKRQCCYSIGAKINILIIGTVIITTASVGYLVYKGTTEILVRKESDELHSRISRKVTRIHSIIDTLKKDVEFLSNVPPIAGIARAIVNNNLDPVGRSTRQQWEDRLAVIFREFLALKPVYQQIRYIGVSDGGKELVRVDRKENGIERIRRDKLQVKASRRYYKEAIKSKGRIYLSEINLNREHGEIAEPRAAVMRAAATVYDSRKIVGIVVININMELLFDEVIHLGLENKAEILITNGQGDYLKHTDSNKEYGFEYGRKINIQQDYPELSGFFENIKDGNNNIHVEYIDTDTILHVEKIYIGNDSLTGTIGMAEVLNYSEILDDVNKLSNKSLIVISLLMVIGIIAATMLSRAITKPLIMLTVAADKVAAGEKTIALEVSKTEEVKTLTNAFNYMTEEINKRDMSLRDAAKYLRKTNEELDQFAYIVSHDLKAPLRAIKNLATWIEEDLGDDIDDTIKDHMSLMNNRVKRMDSLIMAVLEYSRVGRVAVEIEEVDILQLIKDVVSDIAPGKGMSIKLPETTDIFKTKKILLYQVLLNLLSNATKYHDRERGKIEVSVTDAGDVYEFVVQDDGPGIPQAYQDKVFGIFQTLQARDKVESTGIGLSIVKKIIEEQGGDIWLESEDRGSRFVFTWPKKPAVDPVHQAMQPPSDITATPK
ncbi:MAG: hypothetical protein BMS9Abin36_0788 [Gammaproteobacteria bacterium]|nr:MAG: hypothetical protein BMS9Abin36_0788 [Gammaproteobacteria bacterium]